MTTILLTVMFWQCLPVCLLSRSSAWTHSLLPHNTSPVPATGNIHHTYPQHSTNVHLQAPHSQYCSVKPSFIVTKGGTPCLSGQAHSKIGVKCILWGSSLSSLHRLPRVSYSLFGLEDWLKIGYKYSQGGQQQSLLPPLIQPQLLLAT